MSDRFHYRFALAALLSAFAMSAAAADRACETEFKAVEQAILDATFTGRKDTDRTNLLAKLANAEAKTALGKISDAIDKLLEVSDKATELAGATKPKLDDASGINEAVTQTIGCLADAFGVVRSGSVTFI